MLVRISGVLGMSVNVCYSIVGQCPIGRIVARGNLLQYNLFAPADDVNSIDGILLGLKALGTQCRVDIFRSDVPEGVY